MKPLFFFIILHSLFFIMAATSLAATNLSLETSTPSPQVNQPFEVTININSTDITLGTDVVLNYDPEFLQLNSVTPGTLYPNYSDVNGDTNSGKVVISAVSDFDPNSGITPTGKFATLKFTPLKEGPTEVSFAYGDTTQTGVIPLDGSIPNLLSQAPPPLPLTINRAQTGAPANLRLPLTIATLVLLILVIFLLVRRPRHAPPAPTL